MVTPSPPPASHERTVHALGGFPMLVVNLLLVSALPIALALTSQPRPPGVIFLALLVSALGVLSLKGHFSLQPNEARILILFGHYRGTVRDSGFHWANPFYARYRGRVPSRGQWRPDSVSQTRIGRQVQHQPHRSAVVAEQAVAAGEELQQSHAQGQRQARQSGRDRGRGGLASPRHGHGSL